MNNPGLRNSKKRQRGAVLLVVLLVTVVIGILGAAVSLRSVNEARLVLRQTSSTQAFWLAEAGAQKAYYDITKNNCLSMKNEATQIVCTGCSSCGTGNKVLTGTLGAGTYQVVVNNGATQLTSTGAFAPNANTPALQRAVQASLAGSPLFGYAAFSVGNMTLSNNATVDSYDSALGNYGGANIGEVGNIGTNSGLANAIVLDNNVTIKGGVSTGAGGTVSIGSGVVITGPVTHDNNVSLASVDIPPDLVSAVSPGALSFSNDETKTLTAGDYKYDNIIFNNNVKLIISGDVNLYLTEDPALQSGNNAQVIINSDSRLNIYAEGRVIFGNNVILNNLSKLPSNFIIYSRYTGANGVTISNNGTFYGAIYAPDTDIDMSNNVTVYGAMVGKTIDISNNDKVHFDEALTALSDPNSPAGLSDWQEVSP